MSIKRIITALIGFPIVILFLVFGNKYMLDIVFACVAIISMYEYTKCVSHKAKVVSWLGYVCALSIALIHIVQYNVISFITTFGIPVLLFLLFAHVIISNMKITFEDIAFTLIGILYIFCFVVFLPLIYGIESEISGKLLIWYVIFAAWGTDTFAYLIGRNFGKIKFSKVSPKKTIEGCVSGTIASVIINLIFTWCINKYLGYDISYLTIAVIGTILSIIGQLGDFSASVIKRYFDVKDYSELFPGHGGMLDRIDSVMFIAPFAYMLLTIFL